MVYTSAEDVARNPAGGAKSEHISSHADLILPPSQAKPTSRADPILLSVFACRFMSIAEAMGKSLQQTSISTNIKERLDFSCALFAPGGDLVANAPHLPVHLGSMSFAVSYQARHLHEAGEGDFEEGDVVLTNHPIAGGSHLPDITCITPVFSSEPNPETGKKVILFYTASRAHHADIGGILPGSMPPNSQTIFDEGAQIVSFKVVKKGVLDYDNLVRLLVDEPAKYPKSSGSRCLRDVVSDIQAQIAANQKGIRLLHGLIDEYGLETVQEYMLHIRDNAEQAVRNLLRSVAVKTKGKSLKAIDHMDDGTPIQLEVSINEAEGSAVFDFEGTGPEVLGNFNCPTSVTYSAIIYCLRAMVNMDIPLNQGCLVPITVKIPPHCLLDPNPTAAVVGGNVTTSQRITDVVLKAFEACAASQGCCNNFTFGKGGKNEKGEHVEGWGYYETICGGTGAGETWDGVTCHVAMTNTRITDAEILERRYPVILHRFGLREGSGGEGQHNGGEGAIRDIEFLEDMQVSMLSERRAFQPYGLYGGEPGACGQNIWVKLPRRRDFDFIEGKENLPRRINMGGRQSVRMGAGDRIEIHTPGGGGWGEKGAERNVAEHKLGWESRGSVADWHSTAATGS